MPTFDIYSKRQKRSRGEMLDIYQYQDLPQSFRVQVVHILRDALGEQRQYEDTVRDVFKFIHDTLAREYGVFVLNEYGGGGKYDTAVYEFLLKVKDTEQALDVIELAFKLVNTAARKYVYSSRADPHIEPDAALEELNARFIENGIGYQFESGEIVRMDSKLLHKEVTQPALQVLSGKSFAGANNEFLSAHEHYRHGRYKECLNDCLKAFESVMKSICKKQKWVYSETDTSKKLLEICFQNGLIPTYLQTHFTSLRSSLESGIPTVRNKLSGHGQGETPYIVPRYIAAYLLFLTATSVLLLIDADRDLK